MTRGAKLAMLSAGILLVVVWELGQPSAYEVITGGGSVIAGRWVPLILVAIGVLAWVAWALRLGFVVPLVAAGWLVVAERLTPGATNPLALELYYVGHGVMLVAKATLLAELASMYTGRAQAVALIASLSVLFLIKGYLGFLHVPEWGALTFPPIGFATLAGMVGLCLLGAAAWHPAETVEAPRTVDGRYLLAYGVLLVLACALPVALMGSAKVDTTPSPWAYYLPLVAAVTLPLLAVCGEATRWRTVLLVLLTGAIASMSLALASGALHSIGGASVIRAFLTIAMIAAPACFAAGQTGRRAAVLAATAFIGPQAITPLLLLSGGYDNARGGSIVFGVFEDRAFWMLFALASLTFLFAISLALRRRAAMD